MNMSESVTTPGQSEGNEDGFSQEFAREDFELLGTDAQANEFEVAPPPSHSKIPPVEDDEEPLNEEGIKLNESDQMTDVESEDHNRDETPVPKQSTKSEELATDFFDKPPPEEEEKKKTIDDISGMTEVSEEAAPEVEVKEEDLTGDDKAAVQFKEEPTEEVQGPSEPRPSRPRMSSIRQSLRTQEIRASRGSRSVPRRSSIDGRAVKELEFPEFDRGSIKMSFIGQRRPTISYAELGPRIRVEEDNDLMGFDMGGDVSIVLDDAVEEEEHTATEEEEQAPVLDRGPYYKRHDIAIEEISERKVKNFILQKMLAMYFRRKKMDYVTKEADWSFDQQTKYHRKLEAYGELMEVDKNERSRVNQEIQDTREERENKFNQLTVMFKKMQSREGEIGYGLIHTKTGNPIPDKMVERLIHRQSIQMGQVSSMRLTFIKLKQMVQEKLDAISELNEIAPGFLLADYEQLKILNQSYADKMEEKEEELTRLRTKCASTIQILAHLREKSIALDSDVEDLYEERSNTDFSIFQVRSKLNRTKQHRDTYRHSLNKMRDESGLLTQPTLLRDMEQGLTDAKLLQAELEQITKEYKKRARQITVIRKKIEEYKELRRTDRFSCKLRSSVFAMGNGPPSNIYKGRPTLLIPNIEETAFDSLTAVKPMITMDRRRNNNGRVIHKKRAEV